MKRTKKSGASTHLTTALAHRYAVEVQNRFSSLGTRDADDVETLWTKISCAIKEAATSVIRPKRNIKKPWLTDDTYDVLLKAAARCRGDVPERRRLQGVFNAKAKLDKEAYFNNLADEVQQGMGQNNLRAAYRAIQRISGKKSSSAPAPVHKADGSPCTSTDDILRRWQEHYETALNFPPADRCPELADFAANATPSNLVALDPPSLGEVHQAIAKLKNERAAGIDASTPEMKCAKFGTNHPGGLHSLSESGRVPVDWSRRNSSSSVQEKGSWKCDCGNYRPISLLSVPGKILEHVLLNRLIPMLIESRRPEQSDFTAGRSTMDAILALSLLIELHQEFNRPLHVAYVNLRSAFDSVDRSALWLALKCIGVPDTLLRLVRDLDTNTGARVRVGPTVSEHFNTSSGVPQGCVLAPTLFCRSIDWTMEHMKGPDGVMVGGHNFTDFDYANDIALPAPNQSGLTKCLDEFSSPSRTMGLNVSWQKTNVQCSSKVLPPLASISVRGQQVESLISSVIWVVLWTLSGRCKPDVLRRIGIASSSVNFLSRVWSQHGLSSSTKFRVYQACIISLLCVRLWSTLDLVVLWHSALQAFHMRCQRHILQSEVTGQSPKRGYHGERFRFVPDITDTSSESRRTALFGHVVRLPDCVPAHRALKIAVGAHTGQPPSPSWKRPRGRPRDTWLKPFLRSGVPVWEQWDCALKKDRGPPAQRLQLDTRPWWW